MEVQKLKTYYFTRQGVLKAVDGVGFNVHAGETLGIAGESGCGKTTLGRSIMRLVSPPGKIVGGEILLEGSPLLGKPESEIEKIRWSRISMVFQEAMNALNPILKISDQVTEPILYHSKTKKEDALKKAKEVLELVGIGASRIHDYPHEFSGGMRQRAMIAMALVCDPELVIMDEPVTALDNMVQAQILDLIKDLQKKLKISIIMITHDLSVIAEECDRVIIMYAGKIVESTDTVSLFEHPLHPYSKALINAFPSIEGPKRNLASIPGNPPNLINPPSGCMFHPRCRYAEEICRAKEPVLMEYGRGHYVACHLVKQ